MWRQSECRRENGREREVREARVGRRREGKMRRRGVGDEVGGRVRGEWAACVSRIPVCQSNTRTHKKRKGT